MKELLKKLCELDGVSGYEDEVREFILENVKNHADEVIVDTLGNLMVFKKGAARRTRPAMLCAHMDEVGFLVRRITDDGMLKLATGNGIDPRVLIGRKMRVGKNKIKGIISLKAIHLTTPEERTKAPALGSLYIDIGALSRAEAEKHVKIGDPVVFDSDFYEFGDGFVKAKAIDDRIGCAVLVELLKEDLPYDTWFVFSTEEEIGLRGATVAGRRINPGVALIIEGTTAADLPDTDEHLYCTQVRHGPSLSLIDKGTVYNRAMREKLIAAADKAGVKWQYKKSGTGGNDSGAIHLAADGAVTVSLSNPTRYIHSASNVACLSDIEGVKKLAALFIKEAGDCNV